MKKWSSDRFLGLTAIIVSLGTLFTIVFQTNLIRKQQYASVLPYLEIWPRVHSNSFKLVLMNNGIGPAFIESVKIYFEDSVYTADPQTFTSQVILKQEKVNFYYSTLKEGRLVPAQETIELIGIEDDSISTRKLYNWFVKKDLDLEVTYKSVYGEMWSTKGIGNSPIQLE